MAIIKLGATVVGIRGTIGGITFSANKTGPYSRIWSKPTNPRTAAQSFGRAQFSIFGQAWASLSGAQKAAWDALTAAPPEVVENSLGEVIELSGWQWFCKLVRRRYQVTSSPSLLAPAGSAPAGPAALAFAIDDSDPTATVITYTASYFAANEYLIAFMSQSLNPGAQSKASNFYLTVQNPTPGTSSTQWSTELAARFGKPAIGTLFWMRFHKQLQNGLRSAELVRSTLVLA